MALQAIDVDGNLLDLGQIIDVARHGAEVRIARRATAAINRSRAHVEDLVKSEGLSRDLAESLIAAFDAHGLAIHPDKPVREKIVREHSEWLPAVLRYNAVPSKVLLEICNLSNPEDRELIQTRTFRQSVAEAIVGGLIAYYGAAQPPESLWVSTTAR